MSKILYEKDNLILEGFDSINPNGVSAITIKIFRKNEAVITTKIPEVGSRYDIHNIILLQDKECDDKYLVKKLKKAGIENGTEFSYIQGCYYAHIPS